MAFGPRGCHISLVRPNGDDPSCGRLLTHAHPFRFCHLRLFLFRQQGACVAGKLRSMADDAVSKDGSGSEPMRLVVDMNALRRYDPAETMQFIKRPMDYVAAFQEAAAEVCLSAYITCFFAVCASLLCLNRFLSLEREKAAVFSKYNEGTHVVRLVTRLDALCFFLSELNFVTSSQYTFSFF